MSRMERGIRYASMAANLSTHNFRVGAAIMRGSKLMSIGWNSRKTHTIAKNVRHEALHAEMAALVGTNKEVLPGSHIWVARFNKSGDYVPSYPCPICKDILVAAGVAKVSFFRENEWHTERL